jgi:hypothetical protein
MITGHVARAARKQRAHADDDRPLLGHAHLAGKTDALAHVPDCAEQRCAELSSVESLRFPVAGDIAATN